MIGNAKLFRLALSFIAGFSVLPASAAPTSSTDELAVRQTMAANRLLHGTEPTFTPEFILADVASTQNVGKRRFDNFHGDVSGRYLSAMAQLPEEDPNFKRPFRPANLKQLIHDIITLQQPDGRFGRSSLQFTPEQVGGEHMALLWGNGRLLVGLTDVAPLYEDIDVDSAAIRLGDFMLKTIDVCSTPEMAERLKGLKAHGYICFTQLTEGLALLSKRTGENKYAEAARKIYPMLPERGLQHSHGYLTTLRGVMMLHELLGNPADLAFVEKHYKDLVASSDYTPFGSVNEYFGTVEQHKGSLRTEGCSDADFLSLSLQLWRATGNKNYLERAEHCLVNAFSFNQFSTGDFGHHHLNGNSGYRLGDQNHRAWWCCTMHGMRYLAEARENLYRVDKFTTGTDRYVDVYFNLFDTGGIAFGLRPEAPGSMNQIFQLSTLSTDRVSSFYFRKPDWAEIKLTPRDLLKPDKVEDKGDYLRIRRSWDMEDRVDITMKYKRRLLTTDGKTIPLESVTTTTRGYLFHGPFLMVADGKAADAFLAEPSGGNVINAKSVRAARPDSRYTHFRQEWHLEFDYKHDGFPGKWQVRLRPMGDITFGDRVPVQALLTFE